jgi:Na+-translocating ferredoxin:NAD+ oxidoreductase subunit G
MSNATPAGAAPPVRRTGSFRMVATVALVSFLSGVLIFGVVAATEARIESNKRRTLEAAIFNVLPNAETKQTFAVTNDGFEPVGAEIKNAEKVYAGYDAQGKLVGIAIEAAAQGYQDVIRALYGYSPEKEAVVGFHVLESKETPGLGDRIARDPDFLANFDELDAALGPDKKELVHPIVVVKHGEKNQEWEIDGISGATISSKAVGQMLRESIERMAPFIHEHLDQLRKG